VTLDTAFWIAAAGLIVTSLTATAAKSLRDFSRHDFDELCRRHKAPHMLGELLRWHDRTAVAAECLQTLSTSVYLVAVVEWLGFGFTVIVEPGWPSLALSALAALVVLVAFAVWIPSAVARLWSEGFLFYSWRAWTTVYHALSPLEWGSRFVDTLFHRLAGRIPERPSEESVEEEIRTIVTKGHREGLLEEDAREMIEGIIELGDADVSDVMTPRTDMVSLHVGRSLDEAIHFVIEAGHTRIPVFDKTRDDIVGILYAKDLLPVLAKPPEERVTNLAEILRRPVFVPETKPVDALLAEFQQTRNHMVIVLDEYGGVSGLVTIEDVLEEIVGEIVDEYDDDLVAEIRQIDEQTAEVLSRARIDEVNEELGTSLPEDDDFDTIGGLVFSRLGHIPKVGEQVLTDGVRITVLEVGRRRIERLRVELLDESQLESA